MEGVEPTLAAGSQTEQEGIPPLLSIMTQMDQVGEKSVI